MIFFLLLLDKNQVNSINTYLIKINKTFQNILDELSVNNNLRDFQYNLVLDYMLKNNLVQHFQ